MDSKAVLARFDQERQALALMDHPNIAKVLDGGITPAGQPFFVMELVNGLPLNKFCDEAPAEHKWATGIVRCHLPGRASRSSERDCASRSQAGQYSGHTD